MSIACTCAEDAICIPPDFENFYYPYCAVTQAGAHECTDVQFIRGKNYSAVPCLGTKDWLRNPVEYDGAPLDQAGPSTWCSATAMITPTTIFESLARAMDSSTYRLRDFMTMVNSTENPQTGRGVKRQYCVCPYNMKSRGKYVILSD